MAGQAARSDIHHKAGHTGSHTERLGHIECLFGVVAPSTFGAARFLCVDGQQRNGNVVDLSGVGEVRRQVGQIGANEFKKSQRLTSASKSTTVVRSSHVAAAKRLRRARAGGGVVDYFVRLHCIRVATNEQRSRPREVVETGDAPQPDGRVRGRFAIWRVERAVLRGVLIDTHLYVQRSFHILYRSADPQDLPVARSRQHFQSVFFCPRLDRRIVLAAGAVFFRELFDRKEVAIVRVVAVIEIFQELFQLGLVAVLENKGHLHGSRALETANKWSDFAGNFIARVARHECLRLRQADDAAERNERGKCQHKSTQGSCHGFSFGIV